MAAQYELVRYNLSGAPQLSEDGKIVTQNINAISNQIGNTYESRYVTNTVIPAPTFLLADAANAPTTLQAAAAAFVKSKYPDTV